MIMLICTWILYGQLKYLRNNDIPSKILTFKNDVQKYPGILSVSTAQTTPGGQFVNFNLFSVESENGFKDQGVDCYGIDEDFFKTLGMEIKKGRNFSGLSDTLRSIIVNENMVKSFGWNNPIGKKVKFPGDTTAFYFEVVGVVKDFNQKSLYNPISPLILFYRPNSNGIQIKLRSNNIPSTIAGIKKSWKATFP